MSMTRPFRFFCFTLGSLLLQPHLASSATFSGALIDGQTYALQIEGAASKRYLEAKPDQGSAGLRADSEAGALWRVHAVDKDTYTFEALSNVVGGRYLAIDQSNSIVLKKSDSALSTRWKVQSADGANFSLTNAGSNLPAALLAAQANNNTLALVTTPGEASPSKWKFFPQRLTRDPVAHGDVISLRSMSTVEGPRFLEGSTYDGKLQLQWTDDGVQYSGTRWRIHDNGDATYSLECLGNWPGSRWLSVKNNALSLASTTDRGNATRWQIFRDEGAGILIRNSDSAGNQWLDGWTASGQLGLTSDTGAGHSGSHWQVIKVKTFDPREEGRWSAVETLPTAAVHAIALNSGKILFWSRFVDDADSSASSEGVPKGQSNTYLYDPQNGFAKSISNAPVDPYSSSHTFLPDGRVLVTGGHVRNFVGQKATQIFDPNINTWSRKSDMAWGRWAPSSVTLPNGDIFVMSGANSSENDLNFTPEIWSATNSTWRKLPEIRDCNGGSCTLMYPWLHVAPNGKIFASGANQATGTIDPNNGTWSSLDDTTAGFRGAYMGTSVSYEPGKVMLAGGMPATNSTETIDLNGNKRWTGSSALRTPRREAASTILADGTVLLNGGNIDSTTNDSSAAFAAEIWNPLTKTWSLGDHARVPRLSQSTAVLLADGRVLTMGGGLTAGVTTHKNYQIYSPPYLFRGDRPQILNAPSIIRYEKTFKVSSNAGEISKVHLVRLSSQTHAFNFSQSFASLSFTKTGNDLEITAPMNGNIAPPGPYLLFILDKAGVPSVASFVTLN